MSTFNIQNFWAFCAALKVDTKDRGLITLSPENLFGCQRFFVEQIAKGMSEGVHSFVVLKGRQMGITTISLALDLYWLFKHSGISGSLVTHDEESRDMFKTTLAMYIDGLPTKFKVPIETHNRTQLVARNRSRVAYQVAGTRKNSALGKGKGLTFLHSTETSAYGDPEGLASLKASLSEEHPDRLYIYESTAQGFNHFEEQWERASRSTSERAIFIGWWLKEKYAKSEGTKEYEVYWDGRLSPEERKWVREVKQLYDFDITPAQMAWWRWKLNEEIGDIDLMYQNFPPTENYAFIASGSNFFNTARLTDTLKELKKSPRAHTFKFILKDDFSLTDVQESIDRTCNLRIWQYPVAGGQYVIGADPAFGSSDWADRFCCSVWRCYSDGIEQVAEFNTEDCNTYQFAWVILYLAGAYTVVSEQNPAGGNVMLNLEINGPGQHVWQEMLNMRRMASMTPKTAASQKILMVVANLQNYLYKRLDSFGRPNAYHWQTTSTTKERMLNFFKSEFERGTATLRSEDLIDEMRSVIRDDGQLGAPGRGKDDRVIAASLALVAWADYTRMACMQRNIMRPVEEGSVSDLGPARKSEMTPLLKGYLNRLGIRA